jgi:hypothetical protein
MEQSPHESWYAELGGSQCQGGGFGLCAASRQACAPQCSSQPHPTRVECAAQMASPSKQSPAVPKHAQAAERCAWRSHVARRDAECNWGCPITHSGLHHPYYQAFQIGPLRVGKRYGVIRTLRKSAHNLPVPSCVDQRAKYDLLE